MTTTHEQLQWYAGDDWQIDATLLDENGDPFDLSGAPEIKWALVLGNQRMIDEDDVSVSITDAPAGKCSIMVPAIKTSPLQSGRYQDAIRIVIGGVTSTLAVGNISVTADPWFAPDPVAASKAPPKIRLASG